MKQDQIVKQEIMKTDFLAWRVINAKRRERIMQRNMEYNLRPRLRSEAHH